MFHFIIVLVDEHDKPLLDNLMQDVAEDMREGVSRFYSVLNDADRDFNFVFLRG